MPWDENNRWVEPAGCKTLLCVHRVRLLHCTPKAVLILEAGDNKQWLALSQIKATVQIRALRKGSYFDVWVPLWLAHEKGLIWEDRDEVAGRIRAFKPDEDDTEGDMESLRGMKARRASWALAVQRCQGARQPTK